MMMMHMRAAPPQTQINNDCWENETQLNIKANVWIQKWAVNSSPNHVTSFKNLESNGRFCEGAPQRTEEGTTGMALCNQVFF